MNALSQKDPIRVLVNGAFGKMGQEALKAISKNDKLVLVGQAGRQDDLEHLISQTQAQVVLDLTTPQAVFANALKIIGMGVHPVIGTSGLLPEQIEILTEQCAQKKIGGLLIPNFSIGAVLAMRYATDCARYFPDVEIIELHHPYKLDAPSGTALRTAECISKSRNQPPLPVAGKEILPGARGAKFHDIPIHSIRLPSLLAHQTVMFGSQGERLHIEHHVSNREAYMPGLCLACLKVVELDQLLCGLETIL